MQNLKKELLIVSKKNKSGGGQKGVALYLALLIMAILLSIGLALSVILMGQMRMIKGMGDSVIAFYAADTGIEKALYKLFKEGTCPPCSFTGIIGEASYSVTGYSPGSDCPSPNQYYCIKSVGIYKGTRRSIEAAH